MRYHEFTRRVQEYADLGSRDEAEQITEAVLATLGERLYRTERGNLAAQLPNKLKEMLYAEQPPENTRWDVDRFTVEDFYHRARGRAELPFKAAVKRTKAVMVVLREAISPGEFADLMDELPEEYDGLFELET